MPNELTAGRSYDVRIHTETGLTVARFTGRYVGTLPGFSMSRVFNVGGQEVVVHLVGSMDYEFILALP